MLRLSAIGDTCHVVPLINRLRRAWPDCRITWIIGRVEAKLLRLLPGVELLAVDKSRFRSEWFRLRRALSGRRFDLLLDLQVSLRANLLSTVVRATVKLGFDRARARELQWLFTNARVPARVREHVLDSFLGFADALGAGDRDHPLEWNLPVPADAMSYAAGLIPDSQPTLVISPASSHALRNWAAERYAALADHAARRHGMRVILCGGPSPLERTLGAAIRAAAHVPIIDQIGRDTLPQMLALLWRTTVLLAPDSGPVHMATAVGTPVIGLYAATNPQRSGPYFSRPWCIDRYPEAARRFLGRTPEELPWWTKIERPGVMDLIEVDAVCDRLDEFMQQRVAPAPLG
ncbi:MAG TPA: glycosyltransferase family 9 protein [Steroidobacteraceae bacterium]|nr:glycosyltransferase family 9 protein [Steroidobacteraceae bacterium]